MVRTPPAQVVVATDHLAMFPTCDAALEQACEQIVDAGLVGAGWVIFPEGCLPGYPAWVWALHPGIDPLLDTVCAEVLANAIQIPSDTTDRLCSIAQRAQVNVVIGVIERDGTADRLTAYNTLLVITAQGQILGSYRTGLAREALQGVWVLAKAEPSADESSGTSRIGGL